MKIWIPKRLKSNLANYFGLTPQYLGDVEKGKYCLSVEKLKLLSELTGISIDYIINGISSSTRDKVITLLSKYNEEQVNAIFNAIKSFEVLTSYNSKQ